MSIYKALDLNNSRLWDILREFLEIEETYMVEITGSEEEGYEFRYISSTTHFRSYVVYPSADAAKQALNLALLRSLVYNSELSVFVTDETEVIVLQSERNIKNFGIRQRQQRSSITNEEAHWETQGAFGFTVYRESESCRLEGY